MASSKDTFEPQTFLAGTFACGTLRGIGAAETHDHLCGTARGYGALTGEVHGAGALTGTVRFRGGLTGDVKLNPC